MADEKKQEEGQEAAAAPQGPKLIMGFPLPVFALFAANALIMLAGLGYVSYVSLVYKKPAITDTVAVEEIKKKAEKIPVPEQGPGIPFFENYQEMTINLRSAQGGKSHYVTVEVTLACPNQNCLDAVKERRAKVEDTIQSVFTAHSYTELKSLETKLRVKYELQSRVNEFLKAKNTAVTDVLFQSFIVQ